MLKDRIERYRKDLNLLPNDAGFSEKDLVNHFKGEWREMKRYVLDGVRDSITHDPENKLRPYIDLGGKATDRPFSYATVERRSTRSSSTATRLRRRLITSPTRATTLATLNSARSCSS